jgi:hypothetical protein
LCAIQGCAHTVDRDTSCRLARQERNNILRLSPGELEYLSLGSPAESDARSARSQILAAQSLGGIGAAALVAAFIQDFAADPATNPGVRDAAWALGGGALGLFATSLVLGITSRGASERARNELRDYADRCHTSTDISSP